MKPIVYPLVQLYDAGAAAGHGHNNCVGSLSGICGRQQGMAVEDYFPAMLKTLRVLKRTLIRTRSRFDMQNGRYVSIVADPEVAENYSTSVSRRLIAFYISIEQNQPYPQATNGYH